MSQHDMNIANQGFPAFRADLNAALEALVSSNSGATAPATTFANMPWYDTANNIFKIRNEDNDAWISIFTLNQSTDVITAIGSVTLADVVSLTGTQTLTNKTLTSPAINVINEETADSGVTVDSVLLKDNSVFSLKTILLGSTSGSIEVAAPAVAGTRTLTVPAASGSFMVSGNMPAFSAYASANQTVSDSTPTKVVFDSEEFDTANCFDSTTNYRFTPTVAGYYQVNSVVNCSQTALVDYTIWIYKNGSQYKRGFGLGGTFGKVQSPVSTLVYLNGTTDYVEVYIYSDGTGNATVSGDSQNTYFNGSMVRGA
jgi:hypothetical protein